MLTHIISARDLGPLNSRELASIIWGIAFFAIFMLNKSARISFGRLVKSALRYELVTLCLLFLIWVSISTLLLNFAELWHQSLLKDTVIWALFSGIYLMGRCVQAKNQSILFRDLFRASLAIGVVVEFILNLYTFEVWVEMLLVPVFCLVILLQALSVKVPTSNLLIKCVGCMSAVSGLFFIIFFAISIYKQPQKLLSADMAVQFLLPLYLTATCAPAFYLIALYSRYESLMTSINTDDSKPFYLRFYIFIKLVDKIKADLSMLGSIHRRFHSQLRQSKNHAEIDAAFIEISRFLKTRDGGIPGMKARSIEQSSLRLESLTLPLVPLFRTPWNAAELVIELGLLDAFDGEPPWRTSQGIDWHSHAIMQYESGQLGWTNHISCMHLSSDEAYVEKCRWKIDMLDPDATDEMWDKAVQLLQKYLSSLGCNIPQNILAIDNLARDVKYETSEAYFVISPLQFKFGCGLEFSIESKF